MKYTVLIIDDDLLNRQLMIDMIKGSSLDISIMSADRGEMGVKLASKFNPHLIVMDWNMPGISGSGAIESLKSNPETSSIPVLIATGITVEEEIKKIENSGASGYIIKPFHKVDLLKKIRYIIAPESEL